MKKAFISILLLLILFLCNRSEVDFSYHFLWEQNPIRGKIASEGEYWLEKIILVPDDALEIGDIKSVAHSIGQLPPSLLEKIWNHRVYIKLFTGPLTDQEEARHLSGFTPRGYRNQETTWDQVPGMGGGHRVLIQIGEGKKKHGSVNLELHELAHSIDKIVFGKIRDDALFLAIWKKEAKGIFGDTQYFLNYPEEFFAESFAMFYVNMETRRMLKEKGPLTYAYIENLQ